LLSISALGNSSRIAANNALAQQQNAIERLSSGKRINSAKDDAAGLAISERLTAQINAMEVGHRNIGASVSLLQIAEQGLDSQSIALQRMRELAVQSRNSSLAQIDLAVLQHEFDDLKLEVDRLANSLTFNGRKVLDGSFSGGVIQLGGISGETIPLPSLLQATTENLLPPSQTHTLILDGDGFSGTNYSHGSHVPNEGAAATAASAVGSNPITRNTTATVTSAGSTSSSGAISWYENSSAKFIAGAYNDGLEASSIAVTATAETTAYLSGFSDRMTSGDSIAFSVVLFNVQYTSAGTSGFTDDDPILQADVNLTLDTSDLSNIVSAINSSSSLVLASQVDMEDGRKGVKLYAEGGEHIAIENFSGVHHLDNDGSPPNWADTDKLIVSATSNLTDEDSEIDIYSKSNFNDSASVAGTVTLSSSQNFTLGNIDSNISSTTSSSLTETLEVNLGNDANIQYSISKIDVAIDSISAERAKIGAKLSSLDSAVSTLFSSHISLTAARARILDADFAQETAALTKAQILSQSSTAMIAQANAQAGMVLRLLQGL